MEQFEMGEQHSNIEDWIDRFIFPIDCAAPTLPDELKVKLLMTKLAGIAYSEYSKSCLTKKVTEFTFAQTMEKLKGLFGKPQSIWIDRYECIRAVKHDREEFGIPSVAKVPELSVLIYDANLKIPIARSYIDHSVLAFLHANQQISDKATDLRLWIRANDTDNQLVWKVFVREIWPIFAPNIRR
ncbi:hypothetical protein niasHT_035125 [Heterodera trifolii]|uniref:DUF7083 domain-containing protein n=1 Tax=Heterodera trifolii TaxID=157864 RepID=A0ABD2IHN9_9BILA